jgi:hypothetical protein
MGGREWRGGRNRTASLRSSEPVPHERKSISDTRFLSFLQYLSVSRRKRKFKTILPLFCHYLLTIPELSHRYPSGSFYWSFYWRCKEFTVSGNEVINSLRALELRIRQAHAQVRLWPHPPDPVETSVGPGRATGESIVVHKRRCALDACRHVGLNQRQCLRETRAG